MGNGETAPCLKDFAFPTEDPKLSSQHPQGCLPPSLTTVPGDLVPSPGLCAHKGHMQCTYYMHTKHSYTTKRLKYADSVVYSALEGVH